MFSRIYFQVILFLISLLYLSCRSEIESDLEEWINFNIKSYEKNSILENKWNVSTIHEGLDLKLKKAEKNRTIITVSHDGCADFKTITEAINSIPPHNTRRIILFIAPGIYREKIVINKTLSFITFLGDAMNQTIITGNDTAASINKTDGTPLKTFNSATVAVNANYFIAINIIFENNASFVNETNMEQAVALRISGTKAAFYNCSFYGAQDTLYDHNGTHYFKDCFIQGTVDFIFGHGRSIYENCTINSITKNVTSITAQKRTNATHSSWESGFSFINSTITGTGHVYLGRPWGNYSRVVFSYTYMDYNVLPQGWEDWEGQKRYLNAYYGEYKCSGPGSNSSGRVPWARILTDKEAQPFIGIHFIKGNTWLTSPQIDFSQLTNNA